MKSYRFAALLFSIWMIIPSMPEAAVVIPAVAVNEHPSKISAPPSLRVKDIESRLGRKLTLKERMGLFILKKKLKAEEKKNPGETAMIFGIAGAGLLLISLFGIPYLIIGALASAIVAVVVGSGVKKDNPSDKKARAAVLLGWITLGLIALGLILVAIILSSWG